MRSWIVLCGMDAAIASLSFWASSWRIVSSVLLERYSMTRYTAGLRVEGSVLVSAVNQVDRMGIPLSNHECSYSVEFSRDFRKTCIAPIAVSRLIILITWSGPSICFWDCNFELIAPVTMSSSSTRNSPAAYSKSPSKPSP